jgi:hypothetical protein
MATYSKTSPYSTTPQWGNFLDLWSGKYIPSDVTDARYQIDPVYQLRPDLLAHDMYQDTNLWWVFAVRNPDVLLDPVFSFVPPTIIYIPTRETIRKALGI